MWKEKTAGKIIPNDLAFIINKRQYWGLLAPLKRKPMLYPQNGSNVTAA
jgi:hypothetical protein